MKKRQTIPALEKKLDTAFSKYIRLRDALKNGSNQYAKCVSCGDIKDWKYQMDAGHFVGRSSKAVRHDERNVHAQCKQCNMGGKGTAHQDYREFMVKTYGLDVVNELIHKGKQTHKYDRQWLKDKAIFYRKAFREL